jgi:hypothetical protein
MRVLEFDCLGSSASSLMVAAHPLINCNQQLTLFFCIMAFIYLFSTDLTNTMAPLLPKQKSMSKIVQKIEIETMTAAHR